MPMGSRNSSVRNVTVVVFVGMGNGSLIVRIVVGEICQHDKNKRFCKDCDGRGLCKTPHCTTIRNRKYKGHCFFALYICFLLSAW